MQLLNHSRNVAGIAAISVVLIFGAGPQHVAAASEIEKVYQANCSGCHAADASGNSPGAKLLHVRDLRSPEVRKKSDAELTRIIGKGTSKMPGFENSLGRQKVHALVAYLRELAGKNKAAQKK